MESDREDTQYQPPASHRYTCTHTQMHPVYNLPIINRHVCWGSEGRELPIKIIFPNKSPHKSKVLLDLYRISCVTLHIQAH